RLIVVLPTPPFGLTTAIDSPGAAGTAIRIFVSRTVAGIRLTRRSSGAMGVTVPAAIGVAAADAGVVSAGCGGAASAGAGARTGGAGGISAMEGHGSADGSSAAAAA